MRKRLIALMLAAVMIVLMLPTPALAATSGIYEYTDNGDGTCTIIEYTGSATSISIPETLDGLTVTIIGESAFDYSYSMVSIIIPNSVTTIGDHAFRGCRIADINLGSGITKIGEYAFYGNDISNITFPDRLKEIGNFAFTYNELTNIQIPDSVTSIGGGAFNRNRITTVDGEPSNGLIFGRKSTGGADLTRIVSYGNTKTNVNFIPDAVTQIDDYAFYSTTIKSVTFPDSLTTIGKYAFLGNNLTSVVIPDRVTIIGHDAFQMNDIERVSFGSSLQEIGMMAFSENELTSINLPDSVIKIGSYAFLCKDLNSFKLPGGMDTWEDNKGNVYNDGEVVTNKNLAYISARYYVTLNSGNMYINDSSNPYKIWFTNRFNSDVTIRITTQAGDTVKEIEALKEYAAGTHWVSWDGNDYDGDPVSSGIYDIVTVVKPDGESKKTVKRELSYDDQRNPDISTSDEIKGGKLYRTFRYSNGALKKINIYHGTEAISGVQKTNYYSAGVRTSYRLYTSYGQLKNYVQLYSDGNTKKINYYNTDTGKRYAYKQYDTAGRTTHYIFTYNDGVKPEKTNYYNASTGIRKAYKLYDTAGRMTHYAQCYSDGVKAKKMNYYNPATGVRTGYKTYRTNGSCSCYVKCNSSGKPYKGTYYDEDGNVNKVVYY